MPQIIDSFSGENECYSNFSPHTVECIILGDKIVCKTSEHAFHARKAIRKQDRDYVLDAPSARLAKYRGHQIQLRPGWNDDRDTEMLEIVFLKCVQHEEILNKLIASDDAVLIEGNFHGDDYWGMVRDEKGDWRGQNKLGRIWMLVREMAKTCKLHGFLGGLNGKK